MRGDTLRRIPRPDWDRMLRLCNEWNTHYKMPKVYFEVDDPNTSTTGRVVCEQWLNLEAGIHQELVNQLTSTFFSACFGFWRWLQRQNALQALGDLDRRPPRSSPPTRSEQTRRGPCHERSESQSRTEAFLRSRGYGWRHCRLWRSHAGYPLCLREA